MSHILEPINTPAFIEKAACVKNGYYELFDATQGKTGSLEDMIKTLLICDHCPVKADCLVWADQIEPKNAPLKPTDNTYARLMGTAGGQTPQQRLERRYNKKSKL